MRSIRWHHQLLSELGLLQGLKKRRIIELHHNTDFQVYKHLSIPCSAGDLSETATMSRDEALS